jgi:hypothetical protein
MTSLAKSSSEQSAFVELMAEDSGGWACSPRTRRSNHGRLRQACKLIHCKYNSQTGIFFDLADSSSSFGVPSGEHGAYGSSSESASSLDEPTGAHTQIEGGVNCDNRMLEQTSLVGGDTLIPHISDSGVLAEQIERQHNGAIHLPTFSLCCRSMNKLNDNIMAQYTQ